LKLSEFIWKPFIWIFPSQTTFSAGFFNLDYFHLMLGFFSSLVFYDSRLARSGLMMKQRKKQPKIRTTEKFPIYFC
jgi:hypothetical protein